MVVLTMVVPTYTEGNNRVALNPDAIEDRTGSNVFRALSSITYTYGYSGIMSWGTKTHSTGVLAS